MRPLIARLLAALAFAAFVPACATVQPREDQPHIMDSLSIDFPGGPGCVSIEMDLEITQPPNGIAKKVTTRVTSGHAVTMGNGVDFDMTQTIKIVATIRNIVGNCPPLLPGQQFVFEDVMTRRPNGTYEADLKKFKLVSQPR